jgi:hypothetical protein
MAKRRSLSLLSGLGLAAGLFLALLILGRGPAGAASEAAPPAPAEAERVFIALPAPPPEAMAEAERGDGLSGEAAMLRLAEAAARPLREILERLQREGRIEGFRLRPDLFAVEVLRPAPGALEALSLPAGAALVEGPQALACLRQDAEALRAQWEARRARPAVERMGAAALSAQATNPSIDVYAPPDASYTYVTGRTDPNASVRMRIYRGGQLIVERWTYSSSDGDYSFYPMWLGSSCGGGSGYDWTLRPGDEVEVAVGDRAVRTVVAYVQAWADPQSDTVAGRTDPGRAVEAALRIPDASLCSWTPVTRTGAVDGAGNFSIRFPDFDGQAQGFVYARDGNGNSTFVAVQAFHLEARVRGSSVSGFLRPDVDFTAAVWRGSAVVTQTVGRTGRSDGFFWWWFGFPLQSGDVISVTGGGVTLRLTAVDLRLSFDPAANRVSGVTAPNRRVRINFYKSTYYPVATACNYGSECRGVVSDAAGNFTATSTLDLVRGDGVDIRILDSEGNSQHAGRYVPIIILELRSRPWGSSEIRGYWGDPSATSVTVTLRAPDNTIKHQARTSPSEWDGSFSAWLWSWESMAAGDRVEVTDGRITETTTVPVLTARLDGAARQLRGQAGPGRVVAYLRDYRPESLYYGSSWPSYYAFCAEGPVSGGAYALSFPSSAQVGGMDGADFWAFGSDGHAATFYEAYYTTPFPGLYFSSIQAFTVWARQDGQRLWGVVGVAPVTTSLPVTITVRRGAAVLTSTVATADPAFDLSLGVAMQEGDVIEVRTGAGEAANVTVPRLTVARDTARQEIYGQAPAGKYVQAFAVRWRRDPDEYKARSVRAGSDGSYRAGFSDLFWSNCDPVRLDHRCVRGRADFINEQGHTVSVWEPAPPPLGPDAYEPDDTAAQARPYTGIQLHTFHTVTDTDWITFTVPAADLAQGVPYLIRLSDGYVYGYIRVYTNTAYSPIIEGWFGTWSGSWGVSWTPPAAGTYYLQLEALGGGHCDASYRLLILPVRSRIYLPLIMRNFSSR